MAEDNVYSAFRKPSEDEEEASNAQASGCPFSGRADQTAAEDTDEEASDSPADYADAHASEEEGGVTYGGYLKVEELLELQQPRTGDDNRDETFFIIIHQAYELWFKQLIIELEAVIEEILSGELREARRLMERVLSIEELLVKQIHLLETLTPRDFGAFRNAIRPASGFESVQFREVEFMTGLKEAGIVRMQEPGSPGEKRLQRRFESPDLREALFTRMRVEGFNLPDEIDDSTWKQAVAAFVPLYKEYEKHWELYRLCEALLSHDQWLLTWRFHHVRVVERIIGMKSGTGGSPGVKYLERTLKKRAFPVLIEARTMLDDDELFAGYSRKNS
jgi:tryptophan 2,3-dioxygenase